MRPYRIGTANLLQAMIRLTLLLGPVLSSGSGLSTDADGPIITRLFEYMTESTNIEELILDPKYLYVDAPSHHNPLKDVDAYKANAFICKKCEKTDTDGCILTKLGKEICQLVAADKHEEASKHFREYLKHLNRHEIPPSLPGDGIEISWKSIPEFIGTFIMSQHVEKDDINALMHALRKYKNLPPFQLKNIVVSGADILTDYKSRENNGTNYKIKLENCNLWGISELYDRGCCMECCPTTKETRAVVEAYNDTLATVLFYGMNIQKIEASKQESYLSYDVARRMETLKLIDIMQLITKELMPIEFMIDMDLTPYKDDESIFKVFQSVAQRVIDGKCTKVTSWNLLCWCDVFRKNNMIDEALDHNLQVNFANLAEYLINIKYKNYSLNNLEKLVKKTNSIFPFKLQNIIVSCSDFSKAEGPLFEKVRDSNRGNTGHKKISECSLLEFKFLCQLYKLDERVDDQITTGHMIKSLFWHNVSEGNIPPASTDNFLDSSTFKEISEKLKSEEILILLERGLIFFSEFFRALADREDAYIIFEPLRKEIDKAVEEGKELKFWKELPGYKPEPELFEEAADYTFKVSGLVKLLEVCSEDKDVMELLVSNLFKMQRVLHFKVTRISVDETDTLRRRYHEYFMNSLPREVIFKMWPAMYSKTEIYITSCNMQEIMAIFNTYKSDNEEVNKLFAHILLCCVNIEESLKEDASYEVPECFFAYTNQLPSERLTKLIQAGIVPAELSSNPPGRLE